MFSAELIGQHSLSDALAFKYCQELSKIDTATRSNFEHVLPKLDEQIIFNDDGFLPLIVKEVKESNTSFGDFYAQVYNKFSKQCPDYKVLHGMDTTIQLKDEDYFTSSFCNCFNEQTGGKIENGDLTAVLNTCNKELADKRTYKKKLRKELKNKEISREEFSEYITASFVTECDLIIDQLFSRQAKYLERSTELLLQKKESGE